MTAVLEVSRVYWGWAAALGVAVAVIGVALCVGSSRYRQQVAAIEFRLDRCAAIAPPQDG